MGDRDDIGLKRVVDPFAVLNETVEEKALRLLQNRLADACETSSAADVNQLLAEATKKGLRCDAIRDMYGLTLLHRAVIGERGETVRMLVAEPFSVSPNIMSDGESPGTPLHYACKGHHAAMIDILCEVGADPLVPDAQGFTAQHLAVLFDNCMIATYFLIVAGVPIDVRDAEQRTPLMWAMKRSCSASMVRLMFQHGADINAVDYEGLTPAHFAAQIGNAGGWQMLMSQGARTDIRNAKGDTSAELAIETGHNELLSKAKVSVKELRKSVPFQTRYRINQFLIPLFLFSALTLFPISTVYPYQSLGALVLIVFAYLRVNRYYGIGEDDLNPSTSSLAQMSFVVSILTYFYILYDRVWAQFGLVDFAFMVFTGLIVFPWYSLAQSDPGYLDAVSSDHDTNTKRLKECLRAELSDKEFCITCLIRKPLRSKHCRKCHRCVAVLDHHCPWLNTCIGWKNRRRFVAVSVYLLLCELWLSHVLAAYVTSVLADAGQYDLGWRAWQHSGWLASPWVFGLYWWCTGNLVYHIAVMSLQAYLIGSAVTSNEMLNSYKYEYFWTHMAGGRPSSDDSDENDGHGHSHEGGQCNGNHGTKKKKEPEPTNPFSGGCISNWLDFVRLRRSSVATIDWSRYYELDERAHSFAHHSV